MARFFLWVVFFYALINLSPAYANELTQRKDIQMRVANLFWQRDFAGLDDMARAFREDQSRTSSGVWKLTVFYSGISGLINIAVAEPHDWESVFRISDEWIASSPSSPAAHISKSVLLIKYAAKIRGEGWSHEVKKESWAPFLRVLKIAEDYLLSVKDVASQDPEWYVQMLMIRRNYPKDSIYEALVHEGLTQNQGYYGIYFSYAEYLLPRWHGDISKIELLATKSASLTKATEGMSMYARIYWFLSQTYLGPDLFKDSSAFWPRMKLGLRDILQRYPDEWNLNNFAKFSCLVHDWPTTKELIEQIEKPILEAWKEVDFQSCKNSVGLKQ